MKKNILFFLITTFHLNIFCQEKIIDTSITCPIQNGFYRYYLNDKKDSYYEGEIFICNKINTWQYVIKNSIVFISEYKNGINYLEKQKAILSNTFLLKASLNAKMDTLTCYNYDSFDNLTAINIYWVDKSTIVKNVSIISEANLVQKKIKEIKIDYDDFYNYENIIRVTEIENNNIKSTKYYQSKELDETKILFEYEDFDGKWIHGDKKSFLKLKKKIIRKMKKES